MNRTYYMLALCLVGAASNLFLGVLTQQPLFVGLGIAIFGGSISMLRKMPKLTGGWVAAGVFGIICLLTYLSATVYQRDTCTSLAPGIFLLVGLSNAPLAVLIGYQIARFSKVKFKFSKTAALGFLMVGLMTMLVSAGWMSCSLDRFTLLSGLLSTYFVAWSGMIMGLRKN